ncbi:GNAT family N-acetyltransferase [Gehongia tenuis]|uniref:GNAT family N-acetyltransferase n=1 Tax=Gehongia tenuis TaxID=2763655 RepID=A0A926HLC4_9FIRM|nr:GNAT family N-acetyltransferase [Gehongia tenuis]MBC8531917.1 GNAT family N-acetyltransferase [Gehongia tenuis]
MMVRLLPADAEDADKIFILNQKHVACYEDLPPIQYDRVMAWIRQKIIQNLNRYCCIWADDAKAGYYLMLEEDDRWELNDLYLHEAYQGRRIGTQVIQKCLALAGEKELRLYVFERNVGAIRFYERLGFEKAVRLPGRFIMVHKKG